MGNLMKANGSQKFPFANDKTQMKSKEHLLNKNHGKEYETKESRSTPSSPRQQSSNSTTPRASTQNARASFSRPNRFRSNPQVFRQKRKENYLQRRKPARRPKFSPYLHYHLPNAFPSREIVFWDYKRQEHTIQNIASPSQRLVVPLSAIKIQPDECH